MKELLDKLHGLLYTAQRSAGGVQVNAINEARLVLAKIREQQPGAFDPADMATAAAQGFRDGQMRQIAAAVEIPVRMLQGEDHPDTARLRFMFDCVQKDDDPYTDEVTARVEKEFPTQADIKTFDHFRRVVDIARGVA